VLDARDALEGRDALDTEDDEDKGLESVCPSLLDLFLEVVTATGTTMAMTTITTTTAMMMMPLVVLHHGLRCSATLFAGDRAVSEDSRSW